MGTEGTALVAVEGITKHFGGVQALTDIGLAITAGEVHALVGENGAGKSTLGKVLAGVYRPDSGRLLLRGAPVTFRSPRDSMAAGLTFIAQELAIVPDRSVLDNVFLGSGGRSFGWVRRRQLRVDYDRLSAKSGFTLDPHARAGSLRLADQQKVEILRALACDADLIIMDEPTASLSGADAEQLLDVVRQLRAEGRTVVLVTHFLDQALAVADRVSVLKDGRLVRTAATSEETADSLVEAMLGRSLVSMFPPRVGTADSELALSVESLSRAGEFSGIDLQVRRGEIVGIAGLVGSGRTELAETLVGLRTPDGGSIRVGDVSGPFRSPRQAQRAGLVMVPESRKEHGLVFGRTVRDNVVLPHLASVSRWSFVSRQRQGAALESVLPSVGVDPSRIDSLVEQLSGGNQQKVLFARWLYERPTVLVADEPTRGVDVGARAGLYELLRSIARDGVGVLFISSDNEEVVGLADRVIVMRLGRVVGQLEGDIAEDDILPLMFSDESLEVSA